MKKILTSRRDDLEAHNQLTTTKQITGLENHFLTGASSITYTTKKIRFSRQYFELEPQNLTNLELIEYLAANILLDKDERKFYTNSVWAKIQTQFLTQTYSIEISNPSVRSFSSLVNNFINRLPDKYKLRNPVEVVKYLNEKRYLVFWLLQAYQKIREVFTNEELALIVIFDPEITGWKRLLIAIQTNIDADEAFEKIKILDNNWWLKASSEIGNDLDINIEFNEF